MLHFVRHVTGIDNPSGGWYLWWSGFGADLGMLTAIIAYLRHANCHTRKCWRLGKHPIAGTPYRVCRHHHPRIDIK